MRLIPLICFTLYLPHFTLQSCPPVPLWPPPPACPPTAAAPQAYSPSHQPTWCRLLNRRAPSPQWCVPRPRHLPPVPVPTATVSKVRVAPSSAKHGTMGKYGHKPYVHRIYVYVVYLCYFQLKIPGTRNVLYIMCLVDNFIKVYISNFKLKGKITLKPILTKEIVIVTSVNINKV